MIQLTPRQSELLQHIARFLAAGRPPLTAELIEAMGVARESSLSDLLQPLQRKGYISVQGGVRGRQRIIELTPQGRAAMQLGAPVVGTVTAGPLREALLESEEVVQSLAEGIGFQAGDFLLRVAGDSMTGDGICDGDKVLLRPDIMPGNGEIAGVQVMHEAREWETTLKHVYACPGDFQVELRASNPRYPPIWVPSDQLSIAGVYRGLLRGPLHGAHYSGNHGSSSRRS